MLEFSSHFSLFEENPNKIFMHKFLWKIILKIFSEQVWLKHPGIKAYSRWGASGLQLSAKGATQGSTEPLGRPNQEQRLLGPTISNSY
jgi:hypothetical protein